MKQLISQSNSGYLGSFNSSHKPPPEGANRRKMAKILIVDDEPEMLIILRRIVSKVGHELIESKNGIQALEKFRQEKPDLVISDFDMPGMNGLGLLKEIIKENPDAKVIVISGNLSGERMMALKEAGAFAVLWKPLDRKEFNSAISQALEY